MFFVFPRQRFAWRLSSASTLLLLRREDYFELVEKIERLEAEAERLKERVKGLEKENAKFKEENAVPSVCAPSSYVL